MSEFIVMSVICIFGMAVSFCFFSKLYERKQKSIFVNILIGLLLFEINAISCCIFSNEIINTILFFIINVVYALICFNVSFKNAVIQSLILDVFMIMTEYITIFLATIVAELPFKANKDDMYIMIIYAAVCKPVYFILSQIYALIITKIGHKNNDIRYFLPLFIFPVLTLISSTIFLFTAFNTEVSLTYKVLVTIVSILYVFASIFMFVYYQMLANKESKINELESEKRLYNLNNTYMEILQHQNNELQMVFHDTKNHYNVLNNLDSIEEVRSYISKIYPALEEKNTIKISNNKMLDLIINKYIVFCRKNNIKFDYEVKTANLNYIDDAELSMILNNILDNAVEAAINSEEKQIELSLRHINNMDMLNVVNSCDIVPKHKNNQLLTTKFDTGSHGFGTKIIKKYVKKNNGKYEWSYDDIEHKFHVTILFQKDKRSGTD